MPFLCYIKHSDNLNKKTLGAHQCQSCSTAGRQSCGVLGLRRSYGIPSDVCIHGFFMRAASWLFTP